jgi:dTDP-glucose 4,6-dehydratase
MRNVLVTGGCGFIGSNFINYIAKQAAEMKIINLDKLTYAANLQNVNIDLLHSVGMSCCFIEGDVCDDALVTKLFDDYEIDTVINFAAESHVDNSIAASKIFVQTNVLGTQVLLECARLHWTNKENCRFIQISTDEVYGSLVADEPKFTERSPLKPSSPYSASKAAADLLALSYHHTYGMPIIITRCSNNFGKNQYTEKLIPLMIHNAKNNKPLPVYGDGMNIRDWIYVDDHCSAILEILKNGKIGEVYNVGAECEKTNLEVVSFILDYLHKPHSLIQFVEDRLGHDRRYAIDASKIHDELNWHPTYQFDEMLKQTIDFYS